MGEISMENTPYTHFFLPPDDYEILRFGGETVKDEKHGIETMMKYFHKSGLTEEQLRQNNQKYNLERMFQLVKDYFIKEYGYHGEQIELSNRYQHSINSYVFMDDERGQFVHMDELFESSVMSFFLVIFKWSKEFDNLETYGNCFLYLLFIMNDVSILGDIPNGASNEALLQIIQGDAQIMNLASACYWTVVVFSLAHEVAHSYFASNGKKFSNRRKEELEADAIAYDIVLKIIIDQSKSGESDRVMEQYTYLAPVMYMWFFDLFYYTDRVLYNRRITTNTHPLPKDRVKRLFAIANDDKYDFDTVDGNHLYGGFLDVYDEYRTQLILKKERGKLDKIIRTEERERRQRKDEQSGSKTKRL